MKKIFDLQIVAEIGAVFAVMLSVKWVADSMEIIGAGGIAMWTGIIVATLLMRRRGVTWRDLGLKLPKGWKKWAQTIGLAIAAIVSVAAFMGFVLPLIVEFFGLVMPPEASDRFEFFLGKPLYFFSYLVGVVWFGAALGEELLMRGFVLNRFADFFGQGALGWSLALIIHAIIFGSLHAYQGMPGMIGTGVVALIFGGIYLIGKRNLLPVIIGHGVINTIGLTAYYLSDGAIT